MLHLPDVTQLVADEVVVVDELWRPQEDQVPHRVAVESAKPWKPEEPAWGQDRDPVELDGPSVERQRIEPRLRAAERGSFLRSRHTRSGLCATTRTSAIFRRPIFRATPAIRSS